MNLWILKGYLNSDVTHLKLQVKATLNLWTSSKSQDRRSVRIIKIPSLGSNPICPSLHLSYSLVGVWGYCFKLIISKLVLSDVNF